MGKQTDLVAYLSEPDGLAEAVRTDQAFAVLPWQRRFVRGAFAPDTAIRAALSVARGNVVVQRRCDARLA